MPLKESEFASCENLSKEAYYVMYYGLASYADLDNQLTLEDAINLIEFHRVSEYNRAQLENLKKDLRNGK